MTQDDAAEVIAILKTADDGCPGCVGKLLRDFAAAFPDHAKACWREQEAIERRQPFLPMKTAGVTEQASFTLRRR